MTSRQLTVERLMTRKQVRYTGSAENGKEEVRVQGPGAEEWVGVPMKQRDDGVLVEEVKVVEKKVVEQQRFVYHEMKGHETLPLLALRYNTTAAAISSTNGLLGTLEFVVPGTHLRIPSDSDVNIEYEAVKRPACPKDASIRALIELTGHAITREEATYYLEEHSYEVRAAYDARKADVAWESKNPKKTR